MIADAVVGELLIWTFDEREGGVLEAVPDLDLLVVQCGRVVPNDELLQIAHRRGLRCED